MAERIGLNNHWLFSPQFEEDMIRPEYSEEKMQGVRLPHTVVETPLHYFDESVYQMVSCYRRHIEVPADWNGKRVRLTFEGAAHDSTLYLNGKEVKQHHCGYTAFTVDLSEQLIYGGDNLLTLKLDSRESLNIPPFGYVIDYMTYGGVYREVYLEVGDPISLEDVFCYTHKAVPDPLFKKSRDVELETRLEIAGPVDENYMIRQYLRDGEGEEKLIAESPCVKASDPQGKGITMQKLSANPGEVCLWGLDHPKLYTIRTCIEEAGSGIVFDEKIQQFGFRITEFREDGYYLNGEKVRIRGLNRHQSYPYVGYAMPASMQEADARILKEELGVNAVRTSHYPQSHHFLDACDRLGLLVFTEIPGWQHIGDQEWKDQAIKNTRDMIRQYRNHTSIIIWGVRINESVDDDDFYSRTNWVAHEQDPSRPTGGVRAYKKSHLLEDVYTYNDFIHDGKAPGCSKKADVTPNKEKPYLITEYNGHMYPTKAFDSEPHRREHALRHARVLDAVAGQEGVSGSFGWCMFDYNTHKDFGSGDRICYHGVLDMFRNPKPAAWVYATQQEKEMVLEVSSSMDIGEHPASNRGDTWIFSNADSVKMYKNDRLLKEYFPAESPFKNLKHGPMLVDDYVGTALEDSEQFTPAQSKMVKEILNYSALHGMGNMPFKISLQAAKLRLFHHMKVEDAVRLYEQYVGDWGVSATSYRFEAIKEGKVVKTLVKSPVGAIHLEMICDHNALCEGDTYDVAQVRLRMLDENNNVLPFFNEALTAKVSGPIELIGPSAFSLSGGMGGVYVRTTGEAGEARLELTSPQTGVAGINFTVEVKNVSKV